MTMTQENINITGSKAKYLKVRLKNSSGGSMLRVYFINDKATSYGAAGAYYIPISTYDKDFREYIVNLSDNSNFDGNIKSLRIDVTNNDGHVDFDYIKFVEKK